MIWNAVVHVVLVTAVVVLLCVVVADCRALLYGSFVEDLCSSMLETLGLQRKVRNRVTAMSHSGLEVVFSVELVEPD